MSVNPTPSPLEMTKGYVEFGEAEQWSLHRKHYLNKSNKNRHEE